VAATTRTVLGPALALELLHTCALLHDDVIDRAPTRRGRPTVHHAVADRPPRRGVGGRPRPYGEAVAILLGDLAFVQADELFLAADGPDRTRCWPGSAASRCCARRSWRASTSTCTRRPAAPDRPGPRADGRDAEVRPLLGGPAARDRRAARRAPDARWSTGSGAFGDPLGRAFQVRDDLLGVFGEEAETGKSAASDLAEGKRTLLVAEARPGSTTPTGQRLEAGLGDPDLTARRRRSCGTCSSRCGARAAAEAHVAAGVDERSSVLASLDLPADVADELTAVLAARTTAPPQRRVLERCSPAQDGREQHDHHGVGSCSSTLLDAREDGREQHGDGDRDQQDQQQDRGRGVGTGPSGVRRTTQASAGPTSSPQAISRCAALNRGWQVVRVMVGSPVSSGSSPTTHTSVG
jgi:geranylgeranyl diphosphate synthase, type I